jgi:hypothetical protein
LCQETTSCVDCDERIYLDHAVSVGDEPICARCFDNNYFHCDGCGAWYHNDNYGEDGYCQYCVESKPESQPDNQRYYTKSRKDLSVGVEIEAEERDYHPPYRGFYPDVEIDDEIEDKTDSQLRREVITFLKNKLPGRYQVDLEAIGWSIRIPKDIIKVEWILTMRQLRKLQKRCHLSIEAERKSCGYYSLDKNKLDTDTCSSWVVKIVNEVLGKEVIACDEPKRLQSVKMALEKILEIRKVIRMLEKIIESKEDVKQ